MAQSKKEQIAILTNRLDSLNKEYIKDTTYLSNTVQTIDREYAIMSMKYDEAQDVIKKKSATISEKTNTIKSLNGKNMELMEDLKELRKSIYTLQLENKRIKQSYGNVSHMEKDTVGDETTNQPNCDEIEGLEIPMSERIYQGPYGYSSLVPEDYVGVVFECKDGKVLSMNNYKNGWRHGLQRSWYTNGQLKYEYAAISDPGGPHGSEVADGISREWHENGQLAQETNYLDFDQSGLSREWDENGKLVSELNYRNNDIIGGWQLMTDGVCVEFDSIKKQWINIECPWKQ